MAKSAKECKNLEELRLEIDSLDKEIIRLIALRKEYAHEVVRYKEKTVEAIVAQERYDGVIARRKSLAAEQGLDPEVIEKVYRTIMNYFIDEELKIANLKK